MLRRTCAMSYAVASLPRVINEPMDNFEPNSASAASTKAACEKYRNTVTECPIVIGGKTYTTSNAFERTMPSENKKVIAKGYNATPELAKLAVETAVKAAQDWSQVPFRDRAAIFLKAAHLFSTTYRNDLRATTMLGQGKNPWQAEIDSVAESCDFMRFNVQFAEQLYRDQPISPNHMPMWNSVEYRPLEGFVSTISPFNFTAIAANLVSAPALMGNVVVWKPSPDAILSNYLVYKIFEEAGVPPGVINFLPSEPDVIAQNVNNHPALAGVSFTGSTKVFLEINKQVAAHLETYNNFPRISGETGGKDFHLIHPSANLKVAAAGTIRGAFEYQGQKCSATSRLYAPKSKWAEIKQLLVDTQKQLKMGQPDDFSSFMTAVINESAFNRISSYIDLAKQGGDYNIIAGGKCDRSVGWFVEPTIIETTNPAAKLLQEEIFGPVLTVYVYDDSKPNFWEEVCSLVDTTTKYGLTGSIFAGERDVIISATKKYLRYAAGNFYINDKCTGAVVGQQPFGGARKSGSNDKPGSAQFLTRWVSTRTIKESFDLSTAVSYPHQLPDVVKV